jgi:hypothetical protein
MNARAQVLGRGSKLVNVFVERASGELELVI